MLVDFPSVYRGAQRVREEKEMIEKDMIGTGVTEFEQRQIEALERIAEALEGLSESADLLSDCVGYAPPRWHMTEGFHILRIGGQVDTE